jgi:nitrogen fixation NifU-like protein
LSEDIEPAVDFKKRGDNLARHVNFPLNLGTIEQPQGRATGVGQCGDAIEVSLRVDGERIVDIRCVPHGCAFTIACASTLSPLAKGKTIDQALELLPEDVEAELGGLPPDHWHCARLAANTLGEAIADCYRRRQAARNAGPG